jgi:hypothetical protein
MMNPEFEQKLIDLMDEANTRNMPAVHVVLHMLIGSHTSGLQAEFAKHCCGFSPFSGSLQFGGTAAVKEDFPTELDIDG